MVAGVGETSRWVRNTASESVNLRNIAALALESARALTLLVRGVYLDMTQAPRRKNEGGRERGKVQWVWRYAPSFAQDVQRSPSPEAYGATMKIASSASHRPQRKQPPPWREFRFLRLLSDAMFSKLSPSLKVSTDETLLLPYRPSSYFL